MVSRAMWKTWRSGLSHDKNLGLRPRFLSTRAMFFTRHGIPWSNPTTHVCAVKWVGLSTLFEQHIIPIKCLYYNIVYNYGDKLWKKCRLKMYWQRRSLHINSVWLRVGVKSSTYIWYLMQNIQYLVFISTRSSRYKRYLVLTCTWRQKYVLLACPSSSRTFCQIKKYSDIKLGVKMFSSTIHDRTP